LLPLPVSAAAGSRCSSSSSNNARQTTSKEMHGARTAVCVLSTYSAHPYKVTSSGIIMYMHVTHMARSPQIITLQSAAAGTSHASLDPAEGRGARRRHITLMCSTFAPVRIRHRGSCRTITQSAALRRGTTATPTASHQLSQTCLHNQAHPAQQAPQYGLSVDEQT
jgi:hypothetical protein